MNDEVQKKADDKSSDAPKETKTRLTVGQRLRAEREKLEVTWEDVYQDTRIPVVHLEAIEHDNFEDIPSEGVLKGFVRNYSKFLKLDPDEIIGQLTENDPRMEELTPVSFGTSIKGGFFRDMQGSAIIIGLAVFALVILIAAGAIWWFGTNQGERQESVTEESNGQVEESESVSSDEVNDSGPTTSEVQSQESPQPLDPIDEPTIGSSYDDSSLPSLDSANAQVDEDGAELFNRPNLDNSSTIPLTDSEFDSPEEFTSQDSEDSEQLDSMGDEENPTEEQSHDLEFTFDDISWVQVTDGTGAQLVNGVQEAESELNLDGEAPFVVRLGKASAVKLLYRGEEVALGQYTQRNNTAVFTLQP